MSAIITVIIVSHLRTQHNLDVIIYSVGMYLILRFPNNINSHWKLIMVQWFFSMSSPCTYTTLHYETYEKIIYVCTSIYIYNMCILYMCNNVNWMTNIIIGCLRKSRRQQLKVWVGASGERWWSLLFFSFFFFIKN